MTMEPTILYQAPGPHRGPSGRTYDWKAVATKPEHDQMLKSGWHKSLVEALEAETAAKAPKSSAPAPEPKLPPLPPLPKGK